MEAWRDSWQCPGAKQMAEATASPGAAGHGQADPKSWASCVCGGERGYHVLRLSEAGQGHGMSIMVNFSYDEKC